MNYAPKPGSNAEMLIKAILKAGTIRTPELVTATGILSNNQHSQLLTAIEAGLITACMVMGDKGQKVKEYRAGPGLPSNLKPLNMRRTPMAGSPRLPRTAAPAKAPTVATPTSTRKPKAAEAPLVVAPPQPQVGQNSGSASLENTEMLLAEGRAVANKTPETSGHPAKAPAGDVTHTIDSNGALRIHKGAGVFVSLTPTETRALGDFIFATRLAWCNAASTTHPHP